MEAQQGSDVLTSQSQGVQVRLGLVQRVTTDDYLSELLGRADELRSLTRNDQPRVDAAVDETALGTRSGAPITSLQQLAVRPSGAWFVDLEFIGQAQLVFDLSRPGQIWLRLNHK
jgi:hypothetical protein